MMGKCKVCRWWEIKEGFDNWRGDNNIKMCPCGHPKQKLYIDLGMNQDDTVYFAPDFGCILFEAKNL